MSQIKNGSKVYASNSLPIYYPATEYRYVGQLYAGTHIVESEKGASVEFRFVVEAPQKLKWSAMFKEVEYFGLKIHIKTAHKYIATDADGVMYSFLAKPTIQDNDSEWDSALFDHSSVATLDLGDVDWKDTLREF